MINFQILRTSNWNISIFGEGGRGVLGCRWTQLTLLISYSLIRNYPAGRASGQWEYFEADNFSIPTSLSGRFSCFLESYGCNILGCLLTAIGQQPLVSGCFKFKMDVGRYKGMGKSNIGYRILRFLFDIQTFSLFYYNLIYYKNKILKYCWKLMFRKQESTFYSDN